MKILSYSGLLEYTDTHIVHAQCLQLIIAMFLDTQTQTLQEGISLVIDSNLSSELKPECGAVR